MSENKEDRVLFKNKVKIKDKVKNKVKNKFRDTVMLRVDRSLRDELKEESKRTFVTMSQLVDWALREYLDSVKSLD